VHVHFLFQFARTKSGEITSQRKYIFSTKKAIDQKHDLKGCFVGGSGSGRESVFVWQTCCCSRQTLKVICTQRPVDNEMERFALRQHGDLPDKTSPFDFHKFPTLCVSLVFFEVTLGLFPDLSNPTPAGYGRCPLGR